VLHFVCELSALSGNPPAHSTVEIRAGFPRALRWRE
jgi:hypothetical protein